MILRYAIGKKMHFEDEDDDRLVNVADMVGRSGATSKLATAIVEQRSKSVKYSQKNKPGKSYRNTSGGGKVPSSIPDDSFRKPICRQELKRRKLVDAEVCLLENVSSSHVSDPVDFLRVKLLREGNAGVKSLPPSLAEIHAQDQDGEENEVSECGRGGDDGVDDDEDGRAVHVDSVVKKEVPKSPLDGGLNTVDQSCRKSSRSAAQVSRSISPSRLLPDSLGIPDLSLHSEAMDT